MAASYYSKYEVFLDGLILLASYSTSDISDTDGSVVSILGSDDKILNQESYSKYKSNLPNSTNELVIDGGCHSYFASYGIQKGEDQPTITREEQIKMTADFIEKSL